MVQSTNNASNNRDMGYKYTIITTIYKVGQIVSVEPKENVKTQCEKIRKLHNLQDTNEHMIIEVVNNETGEMREYWNSNNNEIKF